MNLFGLDGGQKEAVGLNFVLEQLNAASPYGREKVRQIAPFRDLERLEECFDNIDKILTLCCENMGAIEEICGLLGHFKDIRATVEKCKSAPLGEVELFEVKSFLLALARLLPALESVCLKGIEFEPMAAALDVLDPGKKRVAPFSIEDETSGALLNLRRRKRVLEAQIQREKGESRDKLLQERTKVVAAEDIEEMRIMEDLSRRLRRFAPAFLANMEALGQLDFVIAKALLAINFGAKRPKISSGRLMLSNMSNPHVAQDLAAKGNQFTKISISLDVGTTIITGANMGGKSIAIRTAVLNTALCGLGFFVFAEKAEIPLFDGICLVSEDLQDARGGLSSFGAEIVRLKDILSLSRSSFLFIALDEPARATNPAEGAAIVRAAAAHFNQSGCVCLISTHYDGVTSDNMKHYQVAGLDASAQAVKAAFIGDYMDYRLIEASADTPPARDALRICRMLELDEELLSKIEAELI